MTFSSSIGDSGLIARRYTITRMAFRATHNPVKGIFEWVQYRKCMVANEKIWDTCRVSLFCLIYPAMIGLLVVGVDNIDGLDQRSAVGPTRQPLQLSL